MTDLEKYFIEQHRGKRHILFSDGTIIRWRLGPAPSISWAFRRGKGKGYRVFWLKQNTQVESLSRKLEPFVEEIFRFKRFDVSAIINKFNL